MIKQVQPGGLWLTPPRVSGQGAHVSGSQLHGCPDWGCCLSRMHCHLRHEPPLPYCVSLVITQPQGLCLLLDCNSFTNLPVSVYAQNKPRVQRRGGCGHNLLSSHGIKCIHVFYLCHVIILTRTWANWDKIIIVIRYAVHSAVPWNIIQSYIFHKQFTRGR